MSRLIHGNLKKPTNEVLGKFFDMNESTVRYHKKSNQENFDNMLREYRMQNSPFIPLEDYNLAMNTNYNEEDILTQKIPGILNKDGTVLIPTIIDDFLSTFKILKEMNGSNIISLSNFKGGVGKSSTAINIATVLSFFCAKVLIVDLDIQGNTTSMFDIYRNKKTSRVDLQNMSSRVEEIYDLDSSDYKYTIVDLMASVEQDNLPEMVKEAIININDKVPTIGQIDIIPNSCSIENAMKFEKIDKYLANSANIDNGLNKVLSLVKDEYDFIIIDTPPSISLPLRMSIVATDYFIITLTADKMAKDGISPFLAPIEYYKKAYDKKDDVVVLGGILNKFQNSNIQKVNKDTIDKTLLVNTTNAGLGDARLFEQVIKNSNVMIEAQSETCSVLVYEPTHEIVRDYFNLSIEIIERIIIDKKSKQLKV